MLQPLHPPFRFGVVEEDVYRGAYPRDRNFQFLKRLKPKTVLSLIPEQPNDSLVKFCFENSINNLWICVSKPKENVPLSYSKIIRCLQVLMHSENLPVYIHCLDGTVVTGMVVACLRKLQLWSVSTAMTEYLRFISEEEIRSEEREFVGKFNSPIEIPVDFPRWLWKGLNVSPISNFKHPSIPCKFLESEAHDLLPVEPHHHYLHLTRAEALRNKTSAGIVSNHIYSLIEPQTLCPTSKCLRTIILPQRISLY
ncbi:protein-tyrosine-phosphatase, variant 2 [Entomophthora muscae]|uniref:Protein-tyrosine-phosphatase, variant 2 n=1 Tax=Entomophthora muscae TaxID=34485 RepID=A0ACC2TH97_9FUNG|nr:protein-tyrosine-phosphatase, variant 2 [Entomophthora muscae]